MKNFYRGGSELYLPDQSLDTLSIGPPTNLRSFEQLVQPPKTKKIQILQRIAYGLMLITFLFHHVALAQSRQDGGADAGVINPLTSGHIIPEALWQLPLHVVNHPSGKDTITLSDYKDKLIILDFWASWCVPCIKSLYKLDTLQAQFPEDVIILPVTYEDAAIAAPFFTERAWNLPTVVSQTALKKYFPHRSIPHQVWIKDGEVLAIPMPEYANPAVIRDALDHKQLRVLTNEHVELDNKLPLFINGNGGDGSELLYYSTISARIKPRVSHARIGLPADNNKALFVNMSPEDLLRHAFRDETGLNKRRVIWEMSDSLYRKIKGLDHKRPSGDYTSDTLFYQWLSANTFCYNLFSKREMDARLIHQIMQGDLNTHFGIYYGIKAVIERREVSCLVLRETGTDSRITTQGGNMFFDLNDPDHYRCVNAPFKPMIKSMLSKVEPELFFLDSTDYNGPADITLPTSIDGNFSKAQSELAKYGLQLFREDIEMDMLIIKEII